MFKAAQRLVQLNPTEYGLLKKLAGELARGPEEKRGEILETIVEVIFPEDIVGGVARAVPEDPETRNRVNAARRYVGQQIHARREELGWTQAQLARKAHIPQSHISRLEAGKHAPTRTTIEHLAKVLQVRPSRLDPGYPDEQQKESK
jgi:DNA-binding XRE family transcriptional regulator